jgi:collagen type VII alpha
MQVKVGFLWFSLALIGACSAGGQSGTAELAGAAGRADAGGDTSASGTAGVSGTAGAGTAGAGPVGGASGALAPGDASGSDASASDAATDLPASAADGGHVEVAHIRETASTNTPEINVAVYADASAQRTIAGGNAAYVASKTYPAGSADVTAFLSELHLVGDVSKIPTASDCGKSVSFGTETIVSADGMTSGDLQCLLATAPDADAMLALDARKLDGTIQ